MNVFNLVFNSFKNEKLIHQINYDIFIQGASRQYAFIYNDIDVVFFYSCDATYQLVEEVTLRPEVTIIVERPTIINMYQHDAWCKVADYVRLHPQFKIKKTPRVAPSYESERNLTLHQKVQNLLARHAMDIAIYVTEYDIPFNKTWESFLETTVHKGKNLETIKNLALAFINEFNKERKL